MNKIALVLLYSMPEGIALISQLRQLKYRLVARPFPSPAIITQEISITFPQAAQKQVYDLTQQIKEDIANLEGLAKTYSHFTSNPNAN